MDLTNKTKSAAVEASYSVAKGNAKVKIPHTTAELIIPCTKNSASIMIKGDREIKLQPLGQMTQLGREFKIWHVILHHK